MEVFVDYIVEGLKLLEKGFIWFFKALKDEPFKAFLGFTAFMFSIYTLQGFYNLYKFKKKPKKEKSILID